MELVLLPGMDGTGNLFVDFVAALPTWIAPRVISYPRDAKHSYAQLAAMVRTDLPDSPFVLLAESFSSPLAVHLAAASLEHLRGLVICAGFVASPAGGLAGRIAYWAAPVLTKLRPKDFLIRHWMLEPGAPAPLVQTVGESIASVKSEVMRERIRAVIRCNAGEELRAVTVPILYLAGTEDRLVGGRGMEQFRSIRREMKVVEIAGPHLILQSRPHEAAAAVAEFVRQFC